VTFDTDASFPKLMFKFGGFLDETEYNEIEGLFGSDKVLEITGEKEVAAAPAAEPKPKAATKVVVKAKPEPEPEVEEAPAPKRGFGAKAAVVEEEEPAPKPKAAAPKAAPKPAVKVEPKGGSLADEIAALMEDMDEDD
jgi:hypothetical protein